MQSVLYFFIILNFFTKCSYWIVFENLLASFTRFLSFLCCLIDKIESISIGNSMNETSFHSQISFLRHNVRYFTIFYSLHFIFTYTCIDVYMKIVSMLFCSISSSIPMLDKTEIVKSKIKFIMI